MYIRTSYTLNDFQPYIGTCDLASHLNVKENTLTHIICDVMHMWNIFVPQTHLICKPGFFLFQFCKSISCRLDHLIPEMCQFQSLNRFIWLKYPNDVYHLFPDYGTVVVGVCAVGNSEKVKLSHHTLSFKYLFLVLMQSEFSEYEKR